MSASGLVKRRVFGCRGKLRNSVGFTDEYAVCYVAGNNLVLYNLHNRQQSFIQGSDGGGGITCMALSHDKRYVALAERGERASVAIWDTKTMRKRKTLRHGESASGSISSMCFHGENDVFLTCGAEDRMLVLWNWGKARALASVELPTTLPVYKVSLSPSGAIACASGEAFLHFYRITEESALSAMPAVDLGQDALYTHCWPNAPQDCCIVGGRSGKLAVFRDGAFASHLAAAPGAAITCLEIFSDGFVCATDGGIFLRYRFDVEQVHGNAAQLFRLEARYEIGAHCRCGARSLALSDTEGTLVAATEDNQLFKVSTRLADAAKPPPVEHLYSAFHGDCAIVGLDICLRKPLAVTVGKDRRIMVWNYETNALELSHVASEEIFSVAFHPSGLHLLVGFADRLRLMNLLMDDVRPYQELNVKACTAASFSNGGQYFAALTAGNSIVVHDFFTCEKLQDLRGHNGRVLSLHWSPDDAHLVSCGVDGAVYEWDVLDGKRNNELVYKGTSFAAVACGSESIYACGSDHRLREVVRADFSTAQELDTGCPLSSVALSRAGRSLYAGTTGGDDDRPGCLRSYALPLGGEVFELPVMAAGVTHVACSYDDQVLLVADGAGQLALFSVRDRAGGSGALPICASFPWSEEVLATRSDLEERRNLMDELERKVDELEVQNDYQMRLKDMHFGERMKEVTEKYTQELEQDRISYELLREEKGDMEVEYEERLKQLEENHQNELQELESGYQQRIMSEVERFQQLVHERALQEARWEEQRDELVATHATLTERLRDDFEARLDEARQLRVGLEQELEGLQRDLAETRDQLEDDIDTEVLNVRRRYEGRLDGEREETLRLKGENGIMKKRFTVLSKEIEDQRESIKDLQDKETELANTISGLRREILNHKREIRSRDDTIGERERRIYELKKKNQELEKFKFVLDYKIRELKRQIEPREVEIGNMKEHIKDMDGELEQFHKSNASLDLMIGDLRSQLDKAQRDIKAQRKRIQQQSSSFNAVRVELQGAVNVVQDPAQLLDAVHALLEKHAPEEEKQPGEVDASVAQEYQRHREYLEATLESLKLKFEMDVEEHRAVNTGVMTENLNLIKQINWQREQNRESKQRLAAQTSQLQHFGQRAAKNVPAAETAGVDAAPAPATAAAERAGEEELREVLAVQRERIAELQEAIAHLQGGAPSAGGPFGREVPLPVDGGPPAAPEAATS